MVNTFYKDYLKKLTVILVSLDFVLSIVKPIVILLAKLKQRRFIIGTTKCAKK